MDIAHSCFEHELTRHFELVKQVVRDNFNDHSHLIHKDYKSNCCFKKIFYKCLALLKLQDCANFPIFCFRILTLCFYCVPTMHFLSDYKLCIAIVVIATTMEVHCFLLLLNLLLLRFLQRFIATI